MYAAILAGGVGTRLWPRSRQARPKQFSDIIGCGRTMIQATADRLTGLLPPDRCYVITGQRYVPLAAEQLAEIPQANIIAEPSGRNTAPAIGLACIHVRRRDPQGVLAILPADHMIQDTESFHKSLQVAAQAARAGYLMTLGIEPDHPHTGYGYIKRGHPLMALDNSSVFAVERFLEKPDRTTAQAFLAEGHYYWNGGIFVCRVDRMLEEMARQLPDLYAPLETIDAALDTQNAETVLAEVWAQMPNVSIDYGVMEGAERVGMTPLQAGWSDVGSWDALEQIFHKGEDGNFAANGNVMSVFSQGNIINSHKRLVALIGIQDLVLVETEDVLLVGRKQDMQQVRTLVEKLHEQGQSALL